MTIRRLIGDLGPRGAFSHDEGGAIAVMLGIAVPIVLGLIGLSIDLGAWTVERSKLQDAADFAALTAAKAYHDPKATDFDVRAVLKATLAGSRVTTETTITVQTDAAFQTVSVSLEKPVHRLFSSFLFARDPIISVTSHAGLVAVSTEKPSTLLNPTCVLSLDKAMMHAIKTTSTNTIVADGCTIYVNSASSKAVSLVNLSGNSTLTSAGTCIVGDVGQGITYMTPPPVTGCPRLADPFARRKAPPIDACTETGFAASGGDPVLSPGVYCGGLTLKGVNTATMLPGLYIIKDGLFHMSGGGVLTGEGVTIILSGLGAGVKLDADSYHLVASSSGPLAGFVMYLDPDAIPAKKSSVASKGATYLEGILYFAGQEVQMSNKHQTSEDVAPWTILIANNVVYSGGHNYIKADATKANVFIPPEITGLSTGGGNSSLMN
jgi:hypothetical protein